MTLSMNRRGFLKTTSALSTTLVVGFNAGGLLAAHAQSADMPSDGGASFNPFVKINADGMVTVVSKHFDMGQGTSTGLPTLVAEELGVPWENVKVEFAPSNNELYKNLAFGLQATGGSTAIANSFMQYRTAGAAARDMLIRAAAGSWNVAPDMIKLENGVLSAGDKTAGIGEMVVAASQLTPAEAPTLKDPSQFTLTPKGLSLLTRWFVPSTAA